MLEVKYTEYGLASRIGDTIYLNKKLLDKPVLCKAILRHEQAHSSDFEMDDVMLDLRGGFLRDVKKDYYKFIIKNPKTWTQFLPVWIYNKKIVFDPVIFGFWIMCIAMIVVIGIIL